MTDAFLPSLPAPRGGAADLLVVAGEHSGDEHAARMVAGLLARRPEVRVAALGGPRLAAAGAQLLLDRTTMSVVGLGEVLRNLGFFRHLIREVVRWVGDHRPRAVCFVDNSGVNLRIAEALRLRGLSVRGGGSIRLLYYVSPQIWASRPGRRFDMARNLDALAVLFPFEPECYEDTTLPVSFVGHPFMAPDYVPPVRFDPSGPVLLLPGSRLKPVSRIFPLVEAGYRAYTESSPGREAVVLYPGEGVHARLRALKPAAGIRLLRTGPPVGASAVLTSSGTMSMHCALAGIPGAIVYGTDPVTYAVARWLVRVPFLGIANIILGEAMYPEYIQGAATPRALARELEACVSDPSRRERTTSQSERLRSLLARPPGDNEADWLAHNLS